jgi:PPOX class probable F420-dependent enzyme
MAQTVPQAYRDLLEKPAIAHLATIMPSGVPQVTPVWIDFDGTYLLVNAARGRQQDKNMQARQFVGLEISDPQNPYRYLSVRGRVVEITEEGADAHIDKLAKKYMGADIYPRRVPDEVRRIYKIEPMRIDTRE